MPNITTLYKS